MASIIDAFRETYSDRLSFFKLAVFAAPVLCSYQLYIGSKNDFSLFYLVAGLTLFFLAGFLIKITNYVVNERESILPPLNPFKLAFCTIKGALAIGPVAIVSCLLANYVCSIINIIPWLDMTLKYSIWIVAASIIATSFLLFSGKERILDAYNIKAIFDKAGDLIVVLIIYILQIVIINLPTTGFIVYALLVLFGQGIVLNIFIAYAIIFNLAATGHYMGQIHYETFEYNKGTKI